MKRFIGLSIDQLRFEHDKRRHQLDQLEEGMREALATPAAIVSHTYGTVDLCDSLPDQIEKEAACIKRDLELIDQAIRAAAQGRGRAEPLRAERTSPGAAQRSRP